MSTGRVRGHSASSVAEQFLPVQLLARPRSVLRSKGVRKAGARSLIPRSSDVETMSRLWRAVTQHTLPSTHAQYDTTWVRDSTPAGTPTSRRDTPDLLRVRMRPTPHSRHDMARSTPSRRTPRVRVSRSVRVMQRTSEAHASLCVTQHHCHPAPACACSPITVHGHGTRTRHPQSPTGAPGGRGGAFVTACHPLTCLPCKENVQRAVLWSVHGGC